MTRAELRAERYRLSTEWVYRVRQTVTQFWELRCRPGMDPDYMPPLEEVDRAMLLTARDRIDEVLNADRNAKEGKRAA